MAVLLAALVMRHGRMLMRMARVLVRLLRMFVAGGVVAALVMPGGGAMRFGGGLVMLGGLRVMLVSHDLLPCLPSSICG